MTKQDWNLNKERLQEMQRSLIDYLRHPLREINHVPDWSWPELLLTEVALTGVTGAVTALVGRSFLGIFYGLLIVPVLTSITIGITSLFFYYLFQIFAGQTLPFRRLVTVVFFANIPFFLLQILSGLIPPISLIGFAFSALILIVGFVGNFQLPRRLVVRIIAAVYAAIFLIWIWGRLDSIKIERNWRSESIEAPEVRLGE